FLRHARHPHFIPHPLRPRRRAPTSAPASPHRADPSWSGARAASPRCSRNPRPDSRSPASLRRDESKTHRAPLHSSSRPTRSPAAHTAAAHTRSPDRPPPIPHSRPSASRARCRTPTSSPASNPSCPTQTPHTTSPRLHSPESGSLRSCVSSWLQNLEGAYSHRPAHSLFVALSSWYPLRPTNKTSHSQAHSPGSWVLGVG